ncbi:MAG: PAS domain-containing protein [Alphaproteobacteria bacterium]|nr:PAS domain-containing protein [Alphaproteobacteria bacterium]
MNGLVARIAHRIAAPVAIIAILLFAVGPIGFWTMLIVIAAAYAAAVIYGRHVAADTEAITRFASALAEDRATEVPALETPAGLSLSVALGRLAGAWQTRKARRAAESDLGSRLIEALPDAVLLLARDGIVLKANDAARTLLGRDPSGDDLARALRAPEAMRAAEAVLKGEDAAEFAFDLSDNVARALVGRAVALPEGAEGAVAMLVLADRTEARRLEAMRSDFVANASHEIRTPLAAVAGFIETLRGPAREDPEARERFLALMAEQTGRIRRLVDDLLSLSRIEANEHRAPIEPVDLAEVLRQAAASLAATAAERAAPITLDLGEGGARIAGDRAELEQVFVNLIDNATKYGAGQAVLVALRREGGMIVATIADQGPGIAREHIPRLTERFYRVDAARSRALGGTGLGLAIVKHIVNRHRGRLAVESEPGSGSRFSVHFTAL